MPLGTAASPDTACPRLWHCRVSRRCLPAPLALSASPGAACPRLWLCLCLSVPPPVPLALTVPFGAVRRHPWRCPHLPAPTAGTLGAAASPDTACPRLWLCLSPGTTRTLAVRPRHIKSFPPQNLHKKDVQYIIFLIYCTPIYIKEDMRNIIKPSAVTIMSLKL